MTYMLQYHCDICHTTIETYMSYYHCDISCTMLERDICTANKVVNDQVVVIYRFLLFICGPTMICAHSVVTST